MLLRKWTKNLFHETQIPENHKLIINKCNLCLESILGKTITSTMEPSKKSWGVEFPQRSSKSINIQRSNVHHFANESSR